MPSSLLAGAWAGEGGADEVHEPLRPQAVRPVQLLVHAHGLLHGRKVHFAAERGGPVLLSVQLERLVQRKGRPK